MTQNGRYCCDVPNAEPKTPIHSAQKINYGQHASVGDKDDKNEILLCGGVNAGSTSGKQKASSWFLKQKVFLEMICITESCRNIFLIGLLFAILSGCSMSSVIVFVGRIKHVLLTHEATSAAFLRGTYEQVIILASVTAFTIITNFAMHMAVTLLGDKINIYLKRQYDRKYSHHFYQQINTELIEKIGLIEKGSGSFEMQCRSAATIISSLIICFYHEARLTLVTIGIIPLAITLDVLSKRLSKKSDALLSSKLSQAALMEKELLLLKSSDNNIANDERLMRLSAELRSCTGHAILHQVWKSSYYGVLCFIVFTFVGCGMLYGGYLLDEDPLVKEGDIFIVVLSMALIATSISTITSHHKAIRKGVHAAVFIRNLEELGHGLMLIQNGNQSYLADDVTVTLITAPEFRNPVLSVTNHSVIRFTNGTKNVLRNYHNHKLFLLLSFILAIIHGLEQPAYNIVMGRVFMTMLADNPNIRVLTLCAIQFSAIGFAVFVSRTAAAVLAALASEHMAVSFRVILARHLLKRVGRQSFSKSEIDSMVDENLSLTTDAKSLYYPHISELISRITSMTTNIILGFIFSWEVALLGLVFIASCLAAQVEMEFEILAKYCKCSDSQRVQNSTGSLKSRKHYLFKAANFSIVQTSGFALKTICYALTAYICYHGYKHQANAFLSVITLFSAIRDAVQLPDSFVELRKSWRAVHRIFSYMYSKPSRSNISSLSESIRL